MTHSDPDNSLWPASMSWFDVTLLTLAENLALDDVLLYGLITQNKAKASFTVLGDFLSYDPYGVMFRKGDTQIAQRALVAMQHRRHQPPSKA